VDTSDRLTPFLALLMTGGVLAYLLRSSGTCASSPRAVERAHTLLRQGLAGRSTSEQDRRALLLLDRRAAALAAGRSADAERAEDALLALPNVH
jgi:hypothetical protein